MSASSNANLTGYRLTATCMAELTAIEAALYEQLGPKLTEWAKGQLRAAGVRIGQTSVNQFMRPGPEGPVHPTKLTSRSTRLARSLTGARGVLGSGSEAISTVKALSEKLVQLIKGTRVEYAGAHEKGFKGRVSVRAHSRRGRSTGGSISVRAHTRQMALAKRAFLHPAVQQELPNLKRVAEKDLRLFLEKALTVGRSVSPGGS